MVGVTHSPAGAFRLKHPAVGCPSSHLVPSARQGRETGMTPAADPAAGSAGVMPQLVKSSASQALRRRAGRRKTAAASPSPPVHGLPRSTGEWTAGRPRPCGIALRPGGPVARRARPRMFPRRCPPPRPAGRPSGRQLAERGHRGGLLVAGEFAPPGPVARLARELGDEDTVSSRPFIDHAFQYQRSDVRGIGMEPRWPRW